MEGKDKATGTWPSQAKSSLELSFPISTAKAFAPELPATRSSGAANVGEWDASVAPATSKDGGGEKSFFSVCLFVASIAGYPQHLPLLHLFNAPLVERK